MSQIDGLRIFFTAHLHSTACLIKADILGLDLKSKVLWVFRSKITKLYNTQNAFELDFVSANICHM